MPHYWCLLKKFQWNTDNVANRDRMIDRWLESYLKNFPTPNIWPQILKICLSSLKWILSATNALHFCHRAVCSAHWNSVRVSIFYIHFTYVAREDNDAKNKTAPPKERRKSAFLQAKEAPTSKVIPCKWFYTIIDGDILTLFSYFFKGVWSFSEYL